MNELQLFRNHLVVVSSAERGDGCMKTDNDLSTSSREWTILGVISVLEEDP